VAASPRVSAPVYRALARDDLLLLAEDAQRAVGIVRERERLARMVHKASDLFAVALEHHLDRANNAPQFAIRIQALDYAATIIEFCQRLGIRLETEHGATALHERALRIVSGRDEISLGAVAGRDLTLEVVLTYRAIRNYRLSGDYQKAIDLAARPPQHLFASGAQPLYGLFQYETGASLLMRSQPRQVDRALREAGEDYWNTTVAGGHMTRHRLDFVLALAAAEQGQDAAAVSHLQAARHHLRAARQKHEKPGVQDLSATLALAEQLSRAGLTPSQAEQAVDLGREALMITEGIRDRWNVIARSQTPLAIVFRRIYGDIALLAAGLPGPAAAELGFRVALSAKQTGFASRMRAGSLIEGNRVISLIEEIERAENRRSTLVTTGAGAHAELDRLREELKDAVSPMLADTVLPAPADIARLREAIGARFALDFLALPDTLSPNDTGPGTFIRDRSWFRTLIEPDGSIRFESFTPGTAFVSFFAESEGQPAWLDRRDDASGAEDPDWHGLARELLPPRLLAELQAAGNDPPAELLICAHSALSLMPWAALKIDADGTRLIERAVIAQVPVFTCLSQAQVPPVAGPAAVRLVARSSEGVLDIVPEREAWKLPEDDGKVPLSRCAIGPGPAPAALDGTLVQALRDRSADYGFAHIACHGGGTGLDQYLSLPERLTAAQALTTHWPESVLMASCHVGRLFNVEDDEPLSFVMALLTGGSRCVAAAIDEVLDPFTGLMTAEIVGEVRAGGTRLDVALRRAQLKWMWWPEVFWALFSAYVR
jgi:CHAT domain